MTNWTVLALRKKDRSLKWATTLIAACVARLTPKQFKAACDEAHRYLLERERWNEGDVPQ